MLDINNLQVSVDGHAILRGIDLHIGAGEVHAIMGPNGSGKSTLANVLAGRDGYSVDAGQVRYRGRELLPMPAEQRALAGLFLAFQYPVEIPGVSNIALLQAALNARRSARGEPELDAMDFFDQLQQAVEALEMDPDMLYRPVNAGFSGGEKKRNEILQMTLLQPDLAILDETDSGLDIDALQVVSRGVNALRREDRSILLVTHYQRLLEHIVPDVVHVLVDGRIVLSGDRELALELEQRGYAWLSEPAEQPAGPAQSVQPARPARPRP